MPKSLTDIKRQMGRDKDSIAHLFAYRGMIGETPIISEYILYAIRCLEERVERNERKINNA